MNFSEAVRSVLNKYATFEGRARRAEYWYFALLTCVLSIVAQVIGAAGHDAGLITLLLLVWMCSRGTEGPNRFGADPIAAA
ncbi:DUF805 domain-containing protein [Burkholderia cepacia]|uniref:DUF805 domain-containing protein n=1 Tax=Burkholderia cepacia TaxID=292 RepID=UPI00075397C2|nr:DUF805 domain-containing protein [Burkholderia cepacia]KVK91222.1 hypothetical protein WS93_33140 [Burkholderia cepacia]